MDDILDELGLGSLKTVFNDNKVGPKEVLLLTEEEFGALGVSAIGDRATLRACCSRVTANDGETVDILQRLQVFRTKRKKVGAWQGVRPEKAAKVTRRIYLGWKHEGRRRGAGPSSVLVTAGQGGGQQVRDLPRGMSLEELMESAKDIYFPQGVNLTSGRHAVECRF